jgi:hypothetical protein
VITAFERLGHRVKFCTLRNCNRNTCAVERAPTSGTFKGFTRPRSQCGGVVTLPVPPGIDWAPNGSESQRGE